MESYSMFLNYLDLSLEEQNKFLAHIRAKRITHSTRKHVQSVQQRHTRRRTHNKTHVHS
jgi:hypothetical protein